MLSQKKLFFSDSKVTIGLQVKMYGLDDVAQQAF